MCKISSGTVFSVVSILISVTRQDIKWQEMDEKRLIRFEIDSLSDDFVIGAALLEGAKQDGFSDTARQGDSAIFEGI